MTSPSGDCQQSTGATCVDRPRRRRLTALRPCGCVTIPVRSQRMALRWASDGHARLQTKHVALSSRRIAWPSQCWGTSTTCANSKKSHGWRIQWLTFGDELRSLGFPSNLDMRRSAARHTRKPARFDRQATNMPHWEHAVGYIVDAILSDRCLRRTSLHSRNGGRGCSAGRGTGR